MQRQLGLGRYETAWTWLHKLRRAMVRPGPNCLTGTVEVAQSQADIDEYLANLDLDARYRVNDFCCRDNPWQATVVNLMQQADAVIMDVRGVTSERRGRDFELQQFACLPGRRWCWS